MLNDITSTSPKYSALRGYYKLPYSLTPADNLKNYANAPAMGTASLVAAGTGAVEFPDADEQGEQSTFDLRKNNGNDAAGSLSGSFSWSNDAIHRASPGIPFEFGFDYSSSIGFNGSAFETGLDIYAEDNVMGRGWRHSYQNRILAGGNYLAPFAGSGVYYGLLSANGNIETWIRQANGTFRNTHNEYRGEMKEVLGGAYIEWTTPDRVILRFHHPINSASIAAGKIDQIRDFNGNLESFTYDTSGKLVTVTDTAGGAWTFTYTANLLTSVSGPSTNATTKWTVTFTYTTVTVAGSPVSVLSTKSITGPTAYSVPVISATNSGADSTQWQFFYTDSSDAPAPPGLLKRIVDPRGNNDVQVNYDSFDRKSQEYDALGRYTTYKYNVPALRQLTTTEHFSSTTADPLRDRATVETFDRKLRVLSRKDPLGFTANYEYEEYIPANPPLEGV